MVIFKEWLLLSTLLSAVAWSPTEELYRICGGIQHGTTALCSSRRSVLREADAPGQVVVAGVGAESAIPGTSQEDGHRAVQVFGQLEARIVLVGNARSHIFRHAQK